MYNSTLKAAIQAAINTPADPKISGSILQQKLLEIISAIDAGAVFKGVATPASSPSGESNCFYLASAEGTYTNFLDTNGNAIVLAEGEVALLASIYNNDVLRWTKNLVPGRGENSYLHIMYAATQPAQDRDMHDTFTSGDKWIGICADANDTAPDKYDAYQWAKFVGDNGAPGTDGHNPNLGTYLLDTTTEPPYPIDAPATAQDGDYIVVIDEETDPQNPTQRQWIWDSSLNDNAGGWKSTTVDPGAQFQTGEYVAATRIVKDLTTGGITDVLSAEQGFVLNEAKLDKKIGTNLINPDEVILGSVLNSSGVAIHGYSGYAVSGYIPVNTQDIISNSWGSSSSWANCAVYDVNRGFVRALYTQQYTYQEGDYYVRFSFNGVTDLSSTILRANYGTTLAAYQAYYDYKPLVDLKKELSSNTEYELAKKLDKVLGKNLVNPNTITKNKLFNWSGSPATSNNDCITDYIQVNGQNIIANSWGVNNIWAYGVVYDINKTKLRILTSQQYTYQEGDYYVRFSIVTYATTSNLRANYGTTLAAYQKYTDYAPMVGVPEAMQEINGVRVNKTITATVGNDFNSSIYDDRLTSGTKFFVQIDSTYQQLSGKLFNILTHGSNGFTTLGQVACIGNAVEFTMPDDITWAEIYIQQSDKDWNTSVSVKVNVILQKGFVDFVPEIPKMIETMIGTYSAYNIIDVGKGYAFTSVQQAINSVCNARVDNRYLILIHDDQYATQVTDLWRFASKNQHASSINEQCAFIITKDFVDLMGVGRQIKISVKLPYAAANSNQYINCHCLYERGDVRIANLQFESEYTRYTMHEENSSSSLSGVNSNRKKYFKNVIFTYLNGLTYANAIGIGTAPGEHCVYENCIIESYNNGVIRNGIGNLHSHPNYKYPFTYKFINCIISSENHSQSSVYTDIRSGIKPNIIFENCDFGYITDLRSPTSLSGISLNESARDWRNGGMYLEGHSNRGVLGKVTVPCLYLISDVNNVNVDVIDDTSTNENSAYKLLFGDSVDVYQGTTDGKGVYIGSEFIITTDGNAWSLRNRLGDCSSINKTLTVSVGGVSQTITLDENYSAMTSDTDVITNINSKLSGCTVALNYLYEQLHWSDNVRLVKNSGDTTIFIGNIVTSDGSIYNVKKANGGNIAEGIATKRINPGDWGLIIVKGTQYMTGSGVSSNAIVGTKYKCGDGGVLVEDNTDAAQFVCINTSGIFKWLD